MPRGRLVSAVVASILVWSCTSPADLPTVATVTFGTSDSVLVGGTLQLTPTVTDVNGRPTTAHNILYQALTPTVSVDDDGLVTGIAVGSGQVRATAGGVSGVASIRVLAPVTQVVISPQSPTIAIGQNTTLVATLTNGSGQSVSGRAVTWRSEQPAVAIVNAAGVVSAISVGTATIVAASDYDQVSGSATVTVTPGVIPIASITFNPSTDVLISGDPKQYNPVVKDVQGNTLTSFVGRNVLWQSTNQPVAGVTPVSQGGVVTAGLPGSAVITVTIDNVSSNDLNITVVQVATIEIAPSPVSLSQANRTQQLTITLKDSDGNTLTSTRPIGFASQNPTCVSVSSSGLVTGLYPSGVTCPATVTVLVSAGGVIQPVTINLN